LKICECFERAIRLPSLLFLVVSEINRQDFQAGSDRFRILAFMNRLGNGEFNVRFLQRNFEV